MPWMRYIPKKTENTDKRDFSQKACVKITGGTSGDCISNPVKINALRTGSVIKVPVVLAELTLQLNIDATVDLPIAAGDIKDIKNNIKISQCKLLPRTNKLFIKGCINQSIDYMGVSSLYHGKYETLNHCSIEIPFGCTTSVIYNGGEPLEPIPNDSKTFEYNGQPFCHMGKIYESSEDTIEQNRISTENFNELPYCELISSKITELDRYLSHGYNIKGKIIEEKIAINLTVKILQNQQIEVSQMVQRSVREGDS